MSLWIRPVLEVSSADVATSAPPRGPTARGPHMATARTAGVSTCDCACACACACVCVSLGWASRCSKQTKTHITTRNKLSLASSHKFSWLVVGDGALRRGLKHSTTAPLLIPQSRGGLTIPSPLPPKPSLIWLGSFLQVTLRTFPSFYVMSTPSASFMTFLPP